MRAADLENAKRKSATKNAKRGRPDYRIEALAKGLRVLALFSEQRPALRLSDVAAETGMLMPSAYRVAVTLASEGFLEQLPDGRYRPGIKVLTLGFSALRGMDLVDLATVALRALADKTGETVNLAVLSGDRILYLIRLRNASLVMANIQVGSTLPAACTSIGKALLADLDDAELGRRITNNSFRGATGPNAVKDLGELRGRLDQVRAQGYAVQDEEIAYGLRSVAAPVCGADGRAVAGVNVAVNAKEWAMDRVLSDLRPKVIATAADISHLLGHR